MAMNTSSSTLRNFRNNFTILWSTEGGKAKACARRTARMLREAQDESGDSITTSGSNSASFLHDGYYGSSFDDYGANEVIRLGINGNTETGTALVGEERLLIMFVSTTGDAEHTDSIRHTWTELYVF